MSATTTRTIHVERTVTLWPNAAFTRPGSTALSRLEETKAAWSEEPVPNTGPICNGSVPYSVKVEDAKFYTIELDRQTRTRPYSRSELAQSNWSVDIGPDAT
jgi:hypothetical protein